MSSKKAACCCTTCCQCNTDSRNCCYRADDVLTLVVSITYPEDRYCEARCGDNDGLACSVCTSFLDSRDYALTICTDELVEWTRIDEDDGKDTCFPKYIRRMCGEFSWIPYDDGDSDRTWIEYPTCPTCEPDCDERPLICSNVDVCDLGLICDSDGDASTSSPPTGYTACSHDDLDSLSGTNTCLCSAQGCYSLDVIYWQAACVFEETEPGSCLGSGSQVQRTAEGEISFTIERNCDYDAEVEACLPI